MSSLTPSERALQGRYGAFKSWAGTEDRSARTAPARQANQERYERQVDPDGVLDPAERARRAEYARKADMSRLALKSAQARRKSAELKRVADAADAELADAGDGAA